MAGRGSPPGVRFGGRQKGSRNHATLARQSAILTSVLSPLDYLVSVYRDENQPVNVRVDVVGDQGKGGLYSQGNASRKAYATRLNAGECRVAGLARRYWTAMSFSWPPVTLAGRHAKVGTTPGFG
jgi:hypothetical protein